MNKITIIGCGKLGTNLGIQLTKNDFIVSFSSKSVSSAKKAALLTNTKNYTNDIFSSCKNADIIFLTVPDDLIKIICNQISKKIT